MPKVFAIRSLIIISLTYVKPTLIFIDDTVLSHMNRSSAAEVISVRYSRGFISLSGELACCSIISITSLPMKLHR